jgi:hypothetical protein
MNIWMTTFQHSLGFIDQACSDYFCNVPKKFTPSKSSSFKKLSSDRKEFSVRLLSSTVVKDATLIGYPAQDKVVF